MEEQTNLSRFQHLTFDDFRKLAKDNSLSKYEKIGFPNAYREGKEIFIFQDLLSKLPNLQKEGQTVLDIGPGCSDLIFLEIDWCKQHRHQLILVDSQEMLDLLPDEPFIQKIPAHYPDECPELFTHYNQKIDVIIAYSIFHYVFNEGNAFAFLDHSLGLMAEGAQMLIGDIPNISKRKRFFASPAGIQFHQEFTHSNEVPIVKFNQIEFQKIDDAVILSMLMRARNAGYDAYWLPQPPELPMSNRREDILITRN